MVKTISLTEAAIDALTNATGNILYNNQNQNLTLYSGPVGFVDSSIANLEINNIAGQCLRLKYNSSLTNYIDLNIASDGKFNIITNGTSKIVNIQNHNGSTSGLSLNNTLVIATAAEINKLSGLTASTAELNYNDLTTGPGTAEANKALVLDSNRDISNIRNLQTENLTVNGILVTSTATELNYNDIATIGLAEGGKALIVDVNRDISNINNLEVDSNITISNHNGTTTGLTLGNILVTATATELNILDGITASTSELNILDGITASTSELNVLDGITATTTELNYVDTIPGTAEASKALIVDANRDISNIRNLQTTNLTVNGVLVTATATELNYTDVGTVGSAEGGKALVVDANRDISNIHTLTATNLTGTDITGTLVTATQPNITSLGTLTSLSTNALTLNGTVITATASELNKLHGVTADTNEINILDGLTATTAELNILDGVTATYAEINVLDGITATTVELNYTDTTPGTAEASKALVVDANRSITNIGSIDCTTLTVNGVGISSNGAPTPAELTGVTPGTAEASKALVVDANKDITSIRNITSTGLTTTNLTLGSTAITATGTEINILDGVTATTAEINILDGVTATTAELNYVDLTTGPGTAEASKALVVDANKDITSIRNITSTGLTTTNLTLGSTAITATGTEINILDGVTATTAELNYVDLTTGPGTAEASKALVVDANKDITSIRNITSTGLTTTNLTLGSTAITATGTEINILDGVTATTAEINILDGVTATTAELNYVDLTTGPGTAEASKALVVDANKDITSIRNITSTGLTTTNLTLGSTAITATGTEINILDGVTATTAEINILDGVTATTAELNYVDLTTGPGTAEASKALVVDANKDITSIRNITSTGLTTTNLTLGSTAITATGTEINILDGVTATTAELNYVDLTTGPGTAEASKALVVDANKDITSIRNITSTGLTTTNLTLGSTAITATGTEINILDGVTATTAEINILDGVTATTAELNYVDLTTGPGTAEASKALVVDANKDITSIRNITSTGLTTTNLTLGSTAITATGTEINILDGVTATTAELNYLDLTTGPGTAEASKALVVDANKDITSIRNLTATTSLNVSNGNTPLSLRNISSARGLDITIQSAGTYNADIKLVNDQASALMSLYANGKRQLTVINNNDIVNIVNHNGSTAGLSLGGTLVTATAAEINILDGVTATAAEINILDGVTATAAEINILDGVTATAAEINKLDGVTATTAELNYLDLTTDPGTAEASKALVVDANKDITSIRNLTATTLTGTLATAAQTNITSVGNLNALGITPTTKTIVTGQTSTNCLWHSTSDRRFGMRQPDTNTLVMLAYSAGSIYNDYITWTHAGTPALSIDGSVGITDSTSSTSTTTGALVVTGGMGIGGTVNIGNSLVIGQTAQSASSWTTSGIQLRTGATAYTNSSTAASGTAASAVFNSFARPTLNATNTGVTTTNAATVYIANSPSATGNMTITNAYALWVASGRVLFGDSTASSSTTTGALVVTGGMGIGGTVNIGNSLVIGQTAQSASSWTTSGIQLRTGATAYTNSSTAASGTASSAVFNSFAQPTLNATNTGVTTTNAATVYIANSPSATGNMTITNAYALWVASGRVLIGDSTESSSKTTGALVVTGGVGIGGGLNVGTANFSAGMLTLTAIGTGQQIEFRNGASTGEIYHTNNGELWFGTASNNSITFHTNNTRKMTILHTGEVGINTTTPGYKLEVNGNCRLANNLLINTTTSSFGTGPNLARLSVSGSVIGSTSDLLGVFASTESSITTTSKVITFRTSSLEIGSISFTSGGGVSYNTSSDYRLKTDIEPLDGLSILMKLNPVKYKWISNNSYGNGFIAHEVQEHYPYAVFGEKDAIDADGNPEYQSISYGLFTGIIVASIKEQQNIITELEQKNNTLENKVQQLEQQILDILSRLG